VLASITRAVDTGAGAGTPGNFVLTLQAAPPDVVREVDAALFVPEAAVAASTYINTAKIGVMRIEVGNHLAAAGVEMHAVYSLNGGTTWFDAGPFAPLDTVRFPVPGDYAALVAGAVGDNVLMTWGLTGGDGDDVVKVGNIYLKATSSATPPDSPVDPPSDLPEGGPLGIIIHDLHAVAEMDDWADAASVTTMTDRAGYLPSGDGDASVNGVIGQSAPTMDYDGFSGGLPCIVFDGTNDGLEIGASQLTGGAFTTYFVLDAISAPGGDYGTPWNGNVFPNGKGFLFEADGDVGIYVNTSVPVPTYTSVADTWTKANPHIYAFVYNQLSGRMKLFVDDTEVITFTDGNLVASTLATKIRMGAYTGVFPLAFKLGRVTTWNAAHEGTVGDVVRDALRAYWGTP
jgi:hypothetical protein